MLKYLKIIINYFLKSFVRNLTKTSFKHRVKDNLAEIVERRERKKIIRLIYYSHLVAFF